MPRSSATRRRRAASRRVDRREPDRRGARRDHAADRRRRPRDRELATLPAEPGVYLLSDEHGKVIYVGKAKSLRSRVRSYFRGGDERSQVPFLVRRVGDFETLVTRNEKEALILENNLIKQYKPRYNIRLKDDKSYVSVKVDAHDDVAARPRHAQDRRGRQPLLRSVLTRRRRCARRSTPSARCFRCAPAATPCSATARGRASSTRSSAASGPCCLPVDRAEYERICANAMLLLEGKNRRAGARRCAARMEAASEALRFEEAARLRDQMRAIEKTAERQQAVVALGRRSGRLRPLPRGRLHRDRRCCSSARGKLTGNQAYSFDDFELPDDEVAGARC